MKRQGEKIRQLARFIEDGKLEDLYDLEIKDILSFNESGKKYVYKKVALYNLENGECTKLDLVKFLVDANLYDGKLLELIVLEGFCDEDINIVEYLLSIGVTVTDRTYRAAVCRRLMNVLKVFLSYGIVPPPEAIGIAEKADFTNILDMFTNEGFYSKNDILF